MAKRKQRNIPATVPQIIDRIVELYKRRVSWHKAQKSLILQAKAICRRLCDNNKDAADLLYAKIEKMPSDHLLTIAMEAEAFDEGNNGESEESLLYDAIIETRPIMISIATHETYRTDVEKELAVLAQHLPIAKFVEEVNGFSWLSLAALIGSCGDFYRYSTVYKLWKRMGLAVMSDGRQRKMADAQKAKEHGYAPPRRSEAWKIGTSVLRAQTARMGKDEDGKKTEEVAREAGPWRLVYDARKAYEAEKNENGDYADQAARRLREANFGENTEAFKAYSRGRLSKAHLHARAQRYMEKRLIKALYLEWKKVMPLPEELAKFQINREPHPDQVAAERREAEAAA